MAGARRNISAYSCSVGELLKKPVSYHVPVFQRDYAWTDEEIDELWEDITNAISDGSAEYFLGAIVINQGKEANKVDIVDGQQRLTVLSMIFSAISVSWRNNKQERQASGVFHDYLGSEDRKTGELIPKLSLNEVNNAFYNNIVLKVIKYKYSDKKTWSFTNILLSNAYHRISTKLESWIQDEYDNDYESALVDLEKFISNNINLIIIEAGDNSDAFIIFETLNDRGLELAVADLVKNYLFSLADTNIDRFKRYWGEITILVGSENMTQFLRHYWLSEYELVRERDLYRVLRSKIKNTMKARQFLERIRKVADYYAALINPEHAFWSDFPPESRNYLEALILFKVAQYRPVVLAAMEKCDPSIVTKLLQVLMILSFRYTVISSLGTGNLEKVYSNAAKLIREEDIKSTRAIWDKLKPAYVDDARFVNDFIQKTYTKSNIARYILSEINDKIESDPEHMVAEKLGRVTLEHILPKSGGREWKGAIPSDKDLSEYVDQIGNLTLLEKGKNRGISNISFINKKKKAFSHSSLSINKYISKKTNWNNLEIEDRSKSLANIAKKVWRIDYT